MADIDVKAILAEVLKDEGKELLEELAKVGAIVLFKALPKIAAATPTKVDDMFVPALMLLEPQAMKLLEAINPKDNEVVAPV